MLEPQVQPGMSDQDWYLYVSPFCYGPFRREQIIHLILSHQVDRNAKLQRGDERIWHPILDCINEISAPNVDGQPILERTSERRVAAPRVQVQGVVQADNSTTSITGHSEDISVTGVFVQTRKTRLSLGEHVTLYVKLESEEKIVAKATVVRHNASSKFPIGYGLRFIEIGNSSINLISRLVGIRSISEFGDVVTRV